MPEKCPPKTLVKKYKNALFKETLKEFGLDNKEKLLKSMSKEQYQKEVDYIKSMVEAKKSDDRGLVFFVAKTYPKDKYYQELREKQRFKLFKIFGL